MSIVFTDIYIRNLKTAGRHTDAATQGLNLQIKAGGGKYWTFRYLYQGKRHDLGLGTYPAVSLKEARSRAINARNKLNQGQRPDATWKPQPAVAETKVRDDRPVFSEFAKGWAIRLRPSLVFGPVELPPWNWHFWVLLVFKAGRPH